MFSLLPIISLECLLLNRFSSSLGKLGKMALRYCKHLNILAQIDAIVDKLDLQLQFIIYIYFKCPYLRNICRIQITSWSLTIYTNERNVGGPDRAPNDYRNPVISFLEKTI